MSWTLTQWGRSRSGVSGVPWRTLTDDEYAAACELYPELPDRGYFTREPEASGPVCSCRFKDDPADHPPHTHAQYCAVRQAADAAATED